MSQKANPRVLTESAICVAAAFALSLIPMPSMPLGGSITLFSTAPIIVIGLRHGLKWGVVGALVYSFTQLLLGMSFVLAVPVRNLQSIVLCIALDYILAFTIIGFTGYLSRSIDKGRSGLCAAIAITGLGRLACSFLSGVIVWAPYAWEGWNVVAFSLAYNALWCLPDTAIAVAACLAVTQVRSLGLLPS